MLIYSCICMSTAYIFTYKHISAHAYTYIYICIYSRVACHDIYIYISASTAGSPVMLLTPPMCGREEMSVRLPWLELANQVAQKNSVLIIASYTYYYACYTQRHLCLLSLGNVEFLHSF